MKMGQTTTPETKTEVDWGKVITNIGAFIGAYVGTRPGRQPAPTPTPAPAPTGMSRNTRNLLIGGAVIAAGLLIYSMTKKK